MNSKIAVYTAVVGAYDELPEHKVIYPGADYYCFVGNGEKREETAGPWLIRELDFTNKDSKLVAGYAKTHPRTLLPDYRYTLWIDANIGIADADFFSVIERKMDEGVLLSGIRHPETDCAYDEAVRIVKYGKDKTLNVLRMIRFLRKNKLPRHYGMFETGVLLRRSGDASPVAAFNENWWKLLCGISRRDQLSFPYCMEKAGLEWNELIPPPANVRSHPFFTYREHRAAAPQRSFFYRKTHCLPMALTRWYAKR